MQSAFDRATAPPASTHVDMLKFVSNGPKNNVHIQMLIYGPPAPLILDVLAKIPTNDS
jgi:hypothetical protein